MFVISHSMTRVGLAFATLALLGGCWTQQAVESSTSPEPSASVVESPQSSESASTDPANKPAALADVKVTGAAGAEPTVKLADDFGPATELLVKDLIMGAGKAVEAGADLTVHYVGVGEQSRKVFDSSWPNGQPASFNLSQVIPGWQQGMLGMKPGGRRLLVIPGSLAYGANGSPPVIGADETLVFVVDLVK